MTTTKTVKWLIILYESWDAAEWRAKLPGSDHPIEGSPQTEAGGEEQNDGGAR